MSAESCSNCRFSAPGKLPDKLDCRRRPPVDIARHDVSEWPRVAPDAWCGEFESRPAVAPAEGDKAPRKRRPAVGEVEKREQG